MNITRAMKEERLAELRKLVTQQEAIFFLTFSTLKAKDIEKVRRDVETSEAKYLVSKNSLLKIALNEAQLPAQTPIFDQAIACAFALKDQIKTAKVLVKVAKEHEGFTIVGGIVDGQLIDEAAVRSLAALPGREELLAKVVGSIAAPLSGLVSVLGGNLRGLVSVIHQYEQKKATS